MSESTGKRRRRYVDNQKGKYKKCLIHAPRNLSEECKVLQDFDSKYVKSRPTKDRGNDTIPGKKFKRQQENNAIVNSEVDEMLLHENQKVSDEKEKPEHIESGFNDNKLYQINKMSLEDTK